MQKLARNTVVFEIQCYKTNVSFFRKNQIEFTICKSCIGILKTFSFKINQHYQTK